MKKEKIKQKRKVRGYKITDAHYGKAMKRAAKEKQKLATMIEELVIMYADGKKQAWL